MVISVIMDYEDNKLTFTYLSVSWSELPLDKAMDLKNPLTAGTAYEISELATWWEIIT